MNWVDGIILAVLIVSTIKGYLQGFVTTLINTVAFFAAIIAARLYYADLARYIKENTAFYNKIYTMVLDSLQAKVPCLGERSPGAGTCRRP
ncbi:MAG TPA: CvpA family protein [Bacillota bacterium]|nr:CvpA family protein [Bacillota bacterium]